MSGNMRYFWGVVVLNVITTVSAGMLVKPAVIEKAQSLYKEAPIQDQTNSRNGAARDLRECLVENNVFVIPFPDLLDNTPEPDPFMVPQVTATMCEFTDGNGKPAETVVLRYKPRQLRKEIKRFHECICREKTHKLGRHCHFDMIQTGYNISVLQEVLGNDTRSAIGILTSGSQEFHCHIKKNYTIVCRIKKDNMALNDTKLHRTLVCLSSALTYHVCGENHLPTNPTHPPGTTVLPAGNTSVVKKTTLRFVFLGMGCLLFMLIGIFTTVCVVRCWRQERKRRQKKSIIERPRQHARSNSYADNLNHVYTYLPDEQVPDILQQSSGTAVHSRFGSERSISINSTLRSVSYSPSVLEQGYYEPLTRQDDVPSLPNRPIPKPRWQISVPEGTSHDYLDLIEEDKMEEQDDTQAGPKYFVLAKPADFKNTKEPETNKDGYDALMEDQQTPKDQDEDTKIRETEKGKLEDREPTLYDSTKKCGEERVKDTDYFVLESSKGEESGHLITDDQLDLSDQLDVSTDGHEDDKYEISVPETPSFDLASSFKCKGSPENHDKRQYQDYEKILPKLPEEESSTGGENSYLKTLIVKET